MDAAKLSREVLVLNNESVIYLQMSNPLEAYKLLTQASTLISKLLESPPRTLSQSTHKQFRYDWVDFSDPASPRDRLFLQEEDKDWDSEEGGIPYPFLQALKISRTYKDEHIRTTSRGAEEEEDNDNSDGAEEDEEDDEEFCDFLDEDADWDYSSCRDGDSEYYCLSSGVACAVYFNLAITCNILGRGSEKVRVGGYLEQAYCMYDAARGLIEERMEPSKDWSTLLMAAFNNQSCICHEYSFYDDSISCMAKVEELLARTPYQYYRCIGSDWQVFSLNILLLQKSKLASAA
jgi:hypothetical protein